MTEQQAIESLKNIIEYWTYKPTEVEAATLAIKSLEKQIPMRPINQSTWKACPVCKQGIGVTSKTPTPKAVEYCFHCGQRLDWSFCPKCGGHLLLMDNGNFPEYYEEWLECEKCGFTNDAD